MNLNLDSRAITGRSFFTISLISFFVFIFFIGFAKWLLT